MPETRPLVLSAEKYQFWAIDHVGRQITIVPQQGESVTAPLEGDDVISGIKTSIFDWEKWWVTTITDRDHLINTVGFNAERPDPTPHRPTVYLDQNMWSRVAAAMFAPERVKPERELWAATEIIRFGMDDGIILPLSSAHLLETSALHTDLRYEVGVALASLSGGWQMRHPIDVFEQEAIHALADRFSKKAEGRTRRAVLTTEPNAWKRDESTLGIGPPRPATVELLLEMMSAPGAVISMLVDPSPLERTSLSRWVEHHRRITEQFRTLNLPKPQRRGMARRRFWSEHISTYRSASRVLGFPEVPLFSDRDLKTFLAGEAMSSLLSALFITRFIDSSTRWHENDLVDMFYLSCGAAYCDYVVGEAKTTTQLAQAQRSLGERVTAFRTLGDLVDTLHADGVTTDSERRAVSQQTDRDG